MKDFSAPPYYMAMRAAGDERYWAHLCRRGHEGLLGERAAVILVQGRQHHLILQAHPRRQPQPAPASPLTATRGQVCMSSRQLGIVPAVLLISEVLAWIFSRSQLQKVQATTHKCGPHTERMKACCVMCQRSNCMKVELRGQAKSHGCGMLTCCRALTGPCPWHRQQECWPGSAAACEWE